VSAGRPPGAEAGGRARAGAWRTACASLAKLEIELIFNAIADAMPDIAKVSDPVRLRSGWINGIKRLPVTHRPLK
jgi:cholest-4-en-3-one 26-monooxygenase